MTELEAVRVLHSPLSGPSERFDAERVLTDLGWRPLAILLAKSGDGLGPVGSTKAPWHKGRHSWEEHDGFPRHQHSINGVLTIDPRDPHPNFG